MAPKIARKTPQKAPPKNDRWEHNPRTTANFCVLPEVKPHTIGTSMHSRRQNGVLGGLGSRGDPARVHTGQACRNRCSGRTDGGFAVGYGLRRSQSPCWIRICKKNGEDRPAGCREWPRCGPGLGGKCLNRSGTLGAPLRPFWAESPPNLLQAHAGRRPLPESTLKMGPRGGIFSVIPVFHGFHRRGLSQNPGPGGAKNGKECEFRHGTLGQYRLWASATRNPPLSQNGQFGSVSPMGPCRPCLRGPWGWRGVRISACA